MKTTIRIITGTIMTIFTLITLTIRTRRRGIRTTTLTNKNNNYNNDNNNDSSRRRQQLQLFFQRQEQTSSPPLTSFNLFSFIISRFRSFIFGFIVVAVAPTYILFIFSFFAKSFLMLFAIQASHSIMVHSFENTCTCWFLQNGANKYHIQNIIPTTISKCANSSFDGCVLLPEKYYF